jgi:hypothetical protein
MARDSATPKERGREKKIDFAKVKYQVLSLRM